MAANNEDKDMKPWLLAPLLFFTTAICHPQSISINHPNRYSPYWPHYTVGAANDDPRARTLEEIFAVNQTLARKGNTEAAFELALAYLQGYGTTQDLAQADHWFRIGATTPDEKSIFARLYRDGAYFTKNLDTAAVWYTAAGRPGDFFELAEGYRIATPPHIDKASAIYLDLLKQTGHPEVRRAQMELGNFALDGKYSAGDDPHGRALNLEWARIITQELLGGEEYKIAMDYGIGRGDIPVDKGLWSRFCKRAAAYNIDLAQHFYAEAIMDGSVPNKSGYDDVAWIRLASDKQTGNVTILKALESGMSAEQHRAAEDVYQSLVDTRRRNGAYYPPDDPLRDPTAAVLAAMPQDDPDVQLRTAFALEKTAATDETAYRRALDIYRTVRDRREIDIRFVLGCNLLTGANGLPRNQAEARVWLRVAAERGSQPAKALLATLPAQPYQ
jgi:TPR repeat protein